MIWASRLCALGIAVTALAGCGAGHQLPEISETDSFVAAQDIANASTLRPTGRSIAQNERIARRTLARLEAAAQPICAEQSRPACSYTLEFSPKNHFNAGIIQNQMIMYNGLAKYLETEDEFATVIGHEIGHHISAHYEKSVINQTAGALITGLIFAGIAGATGAYDNNPYAADQDMRAAMAIGQYLGDISFSKEHEREADYVGAYLMTRAGYNPDVGGKVWIKMARATGNMETGLLDSHPAGPDRLAAWKHAVEEVRYSPDLMPNQDGGEPETRLQTARAFNEPTGGRGGYGYGVALASRSTSTGTLSRGLVAKATGTHGTAGVKAVAYTPGPAPDAAWRGHGPSDGCGASWAVELKRAGPKLRGHLWWKGVKYDVYGKIDSWGREREAHAGKSAEARNTPGPRFFKLDVALSETGATGYYAIDSRSAGCKTEFVLTRR